jgi:hypothetical protein
MVHEVEETRVWGAPSSVPVGLLMILRLPKLPGSTKCGQHFHGLLRLPRGHADKRSSVEPDRP